MRHNEIALSDSGTLCRTVCRTKLANYAGD